MSIVKWQVFSVCQNVGIRERVIETIKLALDNKLDFDDVVEKFGKVVSLETKFFTEKRSSFTAADSDDESQGDQNYHFTRINKHGRGSGGDRSSPNGGNGIRVDDKTKFQKQTGTQ